MRLDGALGWLCGLVRTTFLRPGVATASAAQPHPAGPAAETCWPQRQTLRPRKSPLRPLPRSQNPPPSSNAMEPRRCTAGRHAAAGLVWDTSLAMLTHPCCPSTAPQAVCAGVCANLNSDANNCECREGQRGAGRAAAACSPPATILAPASGQGKEGPWAACHPQHPFTLIPADPPPCLPPLHNAGGACGIACSAGAKCAAGRCMCGAVACANGQTCLNNKCGESLRLSWARAVVCSSH